MASSARGIGAQSWASWNFGLLDLNIYCLAASPNFAADDTLYAGAESGVFRSTNGGRAWRETAFPMDFGPVLSMALLPDSSANHTLFVGTETHGVFRSDDGGATWTEAGFQEAQTAVNQLLLARGPVTEQMTALLLAVTNSAVVLAPAEGGAWRDLWARPADSGIVISAATICRRDDEEMLLVGLSDGRVQAVPLPLASSQSQRQGIKPRDKGRTDD